MPEFLSPKWLADRSAPLPRDVKIVNYTVTDAPFATDPVEAHSAAGAPNGQILAGHHDDAVVTVSLPYKFAKALLIERDVAAVMQGYILGEVKVDGDVTALTSAPREPAPEDLDDEADEDPAEGSPKAGAASKRATAKKPAAKKSAAKKPAAKKPAAKKPAAKPAAKKKK